jgi:putative endonuclease
MKAAHLRFGDRGERLAADLLKSLGMEILCRNYHATDAEIDIVARDGEVLCFVEVKARNTLESARTAISSRQQARIRAAAETYHAKHAAQQSGASPGGRFDAIFITPGRWGLPRITHIKNAWQ